MMKIKGILLFYALFLAASEGGCSGIGLTEAQSFDRGNILKNSSFEEQSGNMPLGWVFEQGAANKGSISLDGIKTHSGNLSLKLAPNRNNEAGGIANQPLSHGAGVSCRGVSRQGSSDPSLVGGRGRRCRRCGTLCPSQRWRH